MIEVREVLRRFGAGQSKRRIGRETGARLQRIELPLLVLQGVAESIAPSILGFSLLSLVALECAVGLWRVDFKLV